MSDLFFTEFTSRNPTSTPKLRACLTDIEEHEGLSKDVDRYALLTLVKRVGKALGFTPRMIQLLDYYMSFTRECDWQKSPHGLAAFKEAWGKMRLANPTVRKIAGTAMTP